MKKTTLILAAILGYASCFSQLTKNEKVHITTISGGLFKDYLIHVVVLPNSTRSAVYLQHGKRLQKLSSSGQDFGTIIVTSTINEKKINDEIVKDMNGPTVMYQKNNGDDFWGCLKWMRKLPPSVLTNSGVQGCRKALCRYFDCKQGNNCDGKGAKNWEEMACVACAMERNCEIDIRTRNLALVDKSGKFVLQE
jgi:hypothetical protein